MPNAPITPHVAILGAPLSPEVGGYPTRKLPRFAAGQPLLNVVDKIKWF
jgi:hypothetical protein